MRFPIPEPVRDRIARVYSRSDDTGAASLLGIPPELHNQIYEYLLVDRPSVTIKAEIDENYENISRISDFAGSTAIIHACRQIYHEALGILYGQNVFRFQWSVHRGNGHATIVADPFKACMDWVYDIGTCLSIVRTITIDMGVPKAADIWHDLEIDFELDPNAYKDGTATTPILGLLDIYWDEMASNISIKFENTGETRRSIVYSGAKELEEPHFDFERITNVLLQLGKNDSLGLKGTRRLLQQVYVDPSGVQGTIQYRRTDYGTNVCRNFRSPKGTQTYELVPLPSPLSLLDLPTEIIIDIACLALPNHDVTYNFDTGITHGHEFSLLNVNKQLRRMVRSCFLSRARFTLILSSDTSQPTKTLYEVLGPRIAEPFEDAWLYDRQMKYCTPIEAAQDYENEPTIILQFQTANHIQINAWDLLWTTTTFPPGTTIMVRVRDCSDNVHVTTLGEIRRYALVFLEDLMDKAAPQSRCSPVEFWLNERCLPVRATIWGEHQGSEHAGWDVVDVSNMMDVTALHNAVEATEWTPYGELRGFRGITRPTSWEDQAFYDLVKCLRVLCFRSHG
ncbi:unnamed protein product [Alternaria alternata]